MIDSKKSMKNDWVVYKLKLSRGYLYLNVNVEDYQRLLAHGVKAYRTIIKEKLSENAAEQLCKICRKLTRE